MIRSALKLASGHTSVANDTNYMHALQSMIVQLLWRAESQVIKRMPSDVLALETDGVYCTRALTEE